MLKIWSKVTINKFIKSKLSYKKFKCVLCSLGCLREFFIIKGLNFYGEKIFKKDSDFNTHMV